MDPVMDPIDELENINRDIRTYYRLKWQRDMLNRRLANLNKSLKERLAGSTPQDTEYVTPDGYQAKLTVKRTKPKVDEGTLEQLIVDKNLAAECFRLKIDH